MKGVFLTQGNYFGLAGRDIVALFTLHIGHVILKSRRSSLKRGGPRCKFNYSLSNMVNTYRESQYEI